MNYNNKIRVLTVFIAEVKFTANTTKFIYLILFLYNTNNLFNMSQIIFKVVCLLLVS